MDITFVFAPNIIGLLGLIVLLVFTHFNFFIEKDKLMLFRLAAATNIVIIVFEVIDYFLAESPFELAYVFRRISSATGFALSPVFPLLLVFISYRKKLPYWICIPAGLNILLSFASIFTGHMFFIYPDNGYTRGPLFPSMIIISSFYLFLLIYISFKDLHLSHSGESIFLICIVLYIILGNILEIAFAFHFVFWNGCAVLLICYYLYLHIQYFKFDPLTKVLNRNMFTAGLNNLAKKPNAGVISFDLDKLKKINDTEGHEQGDKFIISAAETIEQCFGDIGNIYRIGGDEFTVLLPNTSEKIITAKIDVFRKKCEENNYTISCGYSFGTSVHDITQLLREADKNMYNNKQERRMSR